MSSEITTKHTDMLPFIFFMLPTEWLYGKNNNNNNNKTLSWLANFRILRSWKEDLRVIQATFSFY